MTQGNQKTPLPILGSSRGGTVRSWSKAPAPAPATAPAALPFPFRCPPRNKARTVLTLVLKTSGSQKSNNEAPRPKATEVWSENGEGALAVDQPSNVLELSSVRRTSLRTSRFFPAYLPYLTPASVLNIHWLPCDDRMASLSVQYGPADAFAGRGDSSDQDFLGGPLRKQGGVRAYHPVSKWRLGADESVKR